METLTCQNGPDLYVAVCGREQLPVAGVLDARSVDRGSGHGRGRAHGVEQGLTTLPTAPAIKRLNRLKRSNIWRQGIREKRENEEWKIWTKGIS